jgi:hypothetical protein
MLANALHNSNLLDDVAASVTLASLARKNLAGVFVASCLYNISIMVTTCT